MTSFANMTPEQRSVHMAKIRGRDTRPELIVRRVLTDAGVSFLTNVEGLPGTPDVVVPGRKIALFVHGCFWHRHGCRRGKSKTKTNREFWARKFERNLERDRAAQAGLEDDGWKVVVVWECETLCLIKLVPRLLREFAPERRVCEHGPHVAVKDRSLCEHCAAYNLDIQREGKSTRRRPRESDSNKVARRVSLDLCVKCGLPSRDGKKTCHSCKTTKRDAAAVKAWTADRHSRGLCRCGKSLAKDRKRCESCLEKLRDEAAERVAKRLAEKKCVHCGEPAKEGHTLCEKHLRKIRKANRKYRLRRLEQEATYAA